MEDKKELTLSVEELTGIVDEAVSKRVGEMSDKFERKAPVADVPVAKQELVGIEKAAAWLRALGTGDLATVKQLSEGVGADGGFIVPTEFRAIVVEKLIKESVMRPFATAIPMGSDTLEVPAEGAAVTAVWTAENVALTESNPTFGQIVLTANKLTGLAKMSRELLADTPINLVNYVAGRFARAFQIEEDKAFMTGSGAGQPTGLRTYGITNVPQAGASLVADDITGLFYALPSQYRRNAVWIMHNDVIKLVRQLKDLDGRYLWTDGFGVTPNTLMGRPVLEHADIPTNLGAGTDESEIFFGDMSYYLIGERQNMEVESTTTGGDAFVNHQLWLKVIERLDGKLSQTEAFVMLSAVK